MWRKLAPRRHRSKPPSLPIFIRMFRLLLRRIAAHLGADGLQEDGPRFSVEDIPCTNSSARGFAATVSGACPNGRLGRDRQGRIHVDEESIQTMNMALNNAANIIKHYEDLAAKRSTVEIVTYGPPPAHAARRYPLPVSDPDCHHVGLHMTISASRPCLKQRCKAAYVTQRAQTEIPLLSKQMSCPLARVRLMELQYEGFAYLPSLKASKLSCAGSGRLPGLPRAWDPALLLSVSRRARCMLYGNCARGIAKTPSACAQAPHHVAGVFSRLEPDQPPARDSVCQAPPPAFRRGPRLLQMRRAQSPSTPAPKHGLNRPSGSWSWPCFTGL